MVQLLVDPEPLGDNRWVCVDVSDQAPPGINREKKINPFVKLCFFHSLFHCGPSTQVGFFPILGICHGDSEFSNLPFCLLC